MISKLAVFHRGGAVLWRSDEEDNTTSPKTIADDDTSSSLTSTSDDTSLASYLAINKLIQTILLSDKTASDSMVYDSFTLKWTFANNLNLVFVAVYFSFQKLLYVDDFLDTVKAKFIQMFHESLSGGIDNLSQQDYSHFFEQFQRIQKYYKTQYRSLKKPKKWNQTKQGSQHEMYKHNNNNKKTKGENNNDDDSDDAAPSPKGLGNKWGKNKKSSKGPSGFNPNKRSKSSKNVSKKKAKKGKKKLKKEHWSVNNVLSFKN